ncbi:hypothetical protein Tco_1164476 [Tanacetum coccineum]
MSSPWFLGTTPTRYLFTSLNFKRSRCLRFCGGAIFSKMLKEGLAIIERQVTSSLLTGEFPSSKPLTNPRQQINDITTRSGKTLEEPSTPLVPTPDVSKPQKELEQNPETSTEKVQNPNLENTAHAPPLEEEESIFMEIPKPKVKKTVNLDPNSPNPNSYPSKLPYP